MLAFTPKFVTFDCYGTLIDFGMSTLTRRLFAGRVTDARMDGFIADFSAFRFDEVLGAWKPYREVIGDALARTARRHGVECRPEDLTELYAAIPTWTPHADVPEPLNRIARTIPVVGLTNSMIALVPSLIAALGAPVHRIITAEETGAYKPRMRAFEYMLDALDARPEEVVHCSSSFRYDLMTAGTMRFGARVFVDRGHEPAAGSYATHRITGLDGLSELLGI